MEEDTPKQNKVELLCSLWNDMTINEQKSACGLLNLYSINDIAFRKIFFENYDMVTEDDIDKDYKGLNYLSWAKAYRMLIERDPSATYEVLRNEDGFVWEQFGTFMVRTKIYAFGKVKEMWLSVMDNAHNPVKLEKLTSNLISNSIMRCLTKNIAMFGIGLKLYEKEDIPKESDNSSTLTKANKEKKKTSKDKLVELCKDVIAQDSANRDKVNNILKKYEPQKGMISKFKVQQVKEAIEEIEKLKK